MTQPPSPPPEQRCPTCGSDDPAFDLRFGCPEVVWDGPYAMRCSLGGGGVVCSVHGVFERERVPHADTTTAARVEQRHTPCPDNFHTPAQPVPADPVSEGERVPGFHEANEPPSAAIEAGTKAVDACRHFALGHPSGKAIYVDARDEAYDVLQAALSTGSIVQADRLTSTQQALQAAEAERDNYKLAASAEADLYDEAHKAMKEMGERAVTAESERDAALARLSELEALADEWERDADQYDRELRAMPTSLDNQWEKGMLTGRIAAIQVRAQALRSVLSSGDTP